jgi:hypothetical protein
MDEEKPSTGERGIPGDWVIYRPDEPLYETLHTCVRLSELRDMIEQGVTETPEKQEDLPDG